MDKEIAIIARSPLLRFGAALVAVALATLIRLMLEPLLGLNVPFVTYYLAVIFAAWYGRFGPALLAIVLSTITAGYFFIPPDDSLLVTELPHQASLALFVLVGIVMALFSEKMHQESERAERHALDLREQREQLQVTLTSIGDGVIVTDAEAHVTFLNDVAIQITGWTLAEANGRPVHEIFNIINEHSQQPVESPVTRVLREGTIVGLANHTILLAKDGRRVPIDDSAAPIRAESGELHGVVLVFRDVTERKQSETSAGFLGAIVNSSQDAIIGIALDGNVLSWNPGAERLYGYSAAEMQGQSVRILVPPGHDADLMGTLQKIQQGEVIEPYEARQQRKDGAVLDVLVTVSPVRDAEGHLSAVSVISRDISERKRAQEAIQQQQAELAERAGLLNLAQDAIVVRDLNGVLTFWNRGAEILYGWSEHEALGHVCMNLLDTELPQPETEIIAILEREGFWSGEVKQSTRDGRRLEVEGRWALRRGDKGQPQAILEINHDITRRKRNEAERARLAAEIEHQRERMNTVVANVPGVVWEAWGQPDEATQRINFVSHYVETMLGYTVQEWLSTPNFWLEIVHPDDKEQAAREALAKFQNPSGGVSQFRWVAKDGRVLWVEAQSVPILDENGQPVGMRGVTMDITERKKAADAQRFLAEATGLLASSLDYEVTLKRLADLVVPELADWCTVDMLDENQQIQQLALAHVDPAKVQWARELGQRYPPQPDAPTGVPNVLRTGKPEFYPHIPEELLVAAARDEEHLKIIREVGMRSAMVVPLVARERTLGAITMIMAESGRSYTEADLTFVEQVAGRAALAVDNARLYREAQQAIDSRDEALAQRDELLANEQQARAMAEEANRAKDEFLATVSHELRTPLNAILGWTTLLRGGRLEGAAAASAMETIERNVRAQTQLIEDILDVSRIITGRMRLNMQRDLDLAALMSAAIDSVKPAAESKGIRLQPVLDPRAGPISGDPDRLQQIIWNLLSNAVKFTAKGGRVQITLRRVESQIEVAVSDTGLGIDPEVLPHIFERFRQADSSSTRRHGGLGLGLAIVRHLVEMHGGTIWANSAGEGHGSTFTLRLPIQPVQGEREERRAEQAQLTRSEEPVRWSPSLSGLKVLVVDDESDTRELLVLTLKQFEATVCSSSDVNEALHMLESWRPDVLVSDIQMPDQDGYDLIRQVRELDDKTLCSIPAVALTAYARLEDRVRALSCGFQMHVAKPVEPSELAAVVASLAGRHQNGQGGD